MDITRCSSSRNQNVVQIQKSLRAIGLISESVSLIRT